MSEREERERERERGGGGGGERKRGESEGERGDERGVGLWRFNAILKMNRKLQDRFAYL